MVPSKAHGKGIKKTCSHAGCPMKGHAYPVGAKNCFCSPGCLAKGEVEVLQWLQGASLLL